MELTPNDIERLSAARPGITWHPFDRQADIDGGRKTPVREGAVIRADDGTYWTMLGRDAQSPDRVARKLYDRDRRGQILYTQPRKYQSCPARPSTEQEIADFIAAEKRAAVAEMAARQKAVAADDFRAKGD